MTVSITSISHLDLVCDEAKDRFVTRFKAYDDDVLVASGLLDHPAGVGYLCETDLNDGRFSFPPADKFDPESPNDGLWVAINAAVQAAEEAKKRKPNFVGD